MSLEWIAIDPESTLCVNMSETLASTKFNVEGEKGFGDVSFPRNFVFQG